MQVWWEMDTKSMLIVLEINFKGGKLIIPTPTLTIRGGEITQIFHEIMTTMWLYQPFLITTICQDNKHLQAFRIHNKIGWLRWRIS